MKRKSYKNNLELDIDENFNFVEEIPDNEVEEYEFDDPQKDKRANLIIIIIILLSLLLFGGGLYYAFIRPNPRQVIENKFGDIFVVHPSVQFGSTINSFLVYNEKEKAHEYTFYIENENKGKIKYTVNLIEKKVASKAMIPKTALNYLLIKNEKEIATGKVSDIDKVLVTETIEKESKDYYILKLWSDYPTQKYFKYEIEITE